MHRIDTFREKLGPAGFTLAIIALIFALAGGAYAASGGLSGKQKKEVKAIAKSYAGKPGAAGAAGTNGTNGTNGKDGAEGKAGPEGKQGLVGNAGASVTSTESAAAIEGHCNGTSSGLGGSKFVVGATKTYACNGKNGVTGFTDTLPPGKTETGVWSNSTVKATAETEILIPISFPIPLPAASEAVYFLNQAETEAEEGEAFDAGCTGNVISPVAPPGALCIYTGSETKEHVSFSLVAFAGSLGYQTSGTVIHTLTGEAPVTLIAEGAWAVTAPTAP